MMFAPAPVTDRFRAEYSSAIALRPWQIRGTVLDGALMVPSAFALHAHYGELAIPVVIMAGDGDLVVGHSHAERLHAAVRGSELQIIPGVGHMVHHVATPQIVQTIEQVARSAGERTPTVTKPAEDAPKAAAAAPAPV